MPLLPVCGSGPSPSPSPTLLVLRSKARDGPPWLGKLPVQWRGSGMGWSLWPCVCAACCADSVTNTTHTTDHTPPPLSFPTPCPSPGGGVGDRHLLNPKFFVAAHCVVVAKPPPKTAAQSIPVESGEHVPEFWSRTKKIYTELVKE